MTGQTAIDRSSPAARAAYADAVATEAALQKAPSEKRAALLEQTYLKFNKACELGNRLGCEDATDTLKLAIWFPLATTAGVAKLTAPAAQRLRTIIGGECRKGFVDACVDYQRDYGKQDPATARPVLEAQCAKEDVAACGALGRRPAGEAAKLAAAVAEEQAKCAGGAADSCLVLGRAYANNAQLKDDGKARRFMEQGCALGNDQACLWSAQFASEGTGGAKDMKQALARLDALCSKAVKDACQRQVQILTDPASGAADPVAAVRRLDGLCTSGDAAMCYYAAKVTLPNESSDDQMIRQYRFYGRFADLAAAPCARGDRKLDCQTRETFVKQRDMLRQQCSAHPGEAICRKLKAAKVFD